MWPGRKLPKTRFVVSWLIFKEYSRNLRNQFSIRFCINILLFSDAVYVYFQLMIILLRYPF